MDALEAIKVDRVAEITATMRGMRAVEAAWMAVPIGRPASGPPERVARLRAGESGGDPSGYRDQPAIDDPIKAAEALFGLWQEASDFNLSLGVDFDDTEASVAERASGS